MIYLDEYHSDVKPDGNINFQKFIFIGDLLLSIEQYQKKSYCYIEIGEIQANISHDIYLDEKIAFSLSYELECAIKNQID
jgi:hypothetical protein